MALSFLTPWVRFATLEKRLPGNSVVIRNFSGSQWPCSLFLMVDLVVAYSRVSQVCSGGTSLWSTFVIFRLFPVKFAIGLRNAYCICKMQSLDPSVVSGLVDHTIPLWSLLNCDRWAPSQDLCGLGLVTCIWKFPRLFWCNQIFKTMVFMVLQMWFLDYQHKHHLRTC